MHLVEFVLLTELNTLFPAVVALEKVGCDPPKLNQLVFLQTLGQWDVVKVVIGIDGSAQCLNKRQRGLWDTTENATLWKCLSCFTELQNIHAVYW